MAEETRRLRVRLSHGVPWSYAGCRRSVRHRLVAAGRVCAAGFGGAEIRKDHPSIDPIMLLTERGPFAMVRRGEMTERPKVPDSKSGVLVRVPRVRIPLSPPVSSDTVSLPEKMA